MRDTFYSLFFTEMIVKYDAQLNMNNGVLNAVNDPQ